MEVPPDFTFSFTSASSTIFTPPSASSTPSPPPERRYFSPGSESPSVVPLIQNLSLNSSPNSMLSPARPSSAHQRPGSMPSTYASQHNASPSPIPRRRLAPVSRRSRRSEGNSSIFSMPSRSTPQVPGAFPASSTSGETTFTANSVIESEGVSGEEVNDNENSDSEETAETSPTGIREESLPAAPIYDSRLQHGLKEVKRELSILADKMALSELNQDHSSGLHALCNRTKEMSMFDYPVTRTVGFIGESGVGKSSLINSLLDQQSLSRSSREGSACTCVVTEFRHVDDDHTGPFTVEADFMEPAEMKELLGELLTTFRNFHVTRLFQELKSKEEQDKCSNDANRAWKTLEPMFSDKPSLTMEYLSEDYDNAHSDIIAQLERWAFASLAVRPGGPDALDYSAVAGDTEECKSILDMLTGGASSTGTPAMWPFIKLIRVYLKSPILRTGLVLADLPGFMDLNFARIRATERYLSRHCDEVFVVVDISRASTNASIQDIMRRCREDRDQPRRIICTRSEDISPEESSRGNTAHHIKVRKMNKQVQDIRKSIEDIEEEAIDASPTTQSRLGGILLNHRRQEKELTFRMKKYLIDERNARVSQQLRSNHGDIKVFCVSNTLYSDYRFSRKSDKEAYIDLTGIRELRRYCQLVPAAASMRSTSAFLENQVPALILSLRQWTLSGADGVTERNAAAVRTVLQNAQNELRRELISDTGPASVTRQNLTSLYDQSITEIIEQHQSVWTAQSIRISLEWAGWSWSTYAAFCRNFGEHQTKAVPNGRCWNEDLLHPAQEHLIPKWESILSSLHEQKKLVTSGIRSLFQKWVSEITAIIQLAPCALENLRQSMNPRYKCIQDLLSQAFWAIMQISQNVNRDMTHGHASSYISGLMQPAYARMNQEGGTGSDMRRKGIMNDHLKYSMLFLNLSRVADEEYKRSLDGILDNLQAKLAEEVESMVRDFSAVLAVEGHISEAERAPALSNALRSRLEAIGAVIESAQIAARDANRQS